MRPIAVTSVIAIGSFALRIAKLPWSGWRHHLQFAEGPICLGRAKGFTIYRMAPDALRFCRTRSHP
jgi:hypothetical protein